MPKNKSEEEKQFEERLAKELERFDNEFPSEEHCMKAITSRPNDIPFSSCQKCESTEGEMQSNQRSFFCFNCKRTTSLTAGTFFHGIKLPRAYLLAIVFHERGIGLSINRFSKIAKVAYATATDIFKKIWHVLDQELVQDLATLYVSSSLFRNVICKRSTETMAREHPRSEQDEIDKNSAPKGSSGQDQDTNEEFHQESSSSSNPADSSGANHEHNQRCENSDVGFDDQDGNDFNKTRTDSEDRFNRKTQTPIVDLKTLELSETEAHVLTQISETPIRFEDLLNSTGYSVQTLGASILRLEIHGLITKFVGDSYVLPYESAPPQQEDPTNSSDTGIDPDSLEAKKISEIALATKTRHHGVSRKDLQLYVAADCCLTNRDKWREGGLLRTCQRSNHVCKQTIRTYVTPPLEAMIVKSCTGYAA